MCRRKGVGGAWTGAPIKSPPAVWFLSLVDWNRTVGYRLSGFSLSVFSALQVWRVRRRAAVRDERTPDEMQKRCASVECRQCEEDVAPIERGSRQNIC
jgi:hypothetical protein